MSTKIINKTLTTQFKHFEHTTKIKKFHPNKIPTSLIKQMFHHKAQSTTTNNLIQNNLFDTIKKTNIKPLNIPNINQNNLIKNKNFTYNTIYQIHPKFDVQNLNTISITHNNLIISNKNINKKLQILQKQHTKLEPIKDHNTNTNNTLTIDFVNILTNKTKPFENKTNNNQTIKINNNQLIPKFENQLINTKKNKTIKININFPKNYIKTLTSKKTIFTYTIKTIKQKILTNLNNEFAHNLKHNNLSTLQTEIYNQQYKRLYNKKDTQIHKKILNKLIKTNNIKIPKTIKTNTQNQLQQELHTRLQINNLKHNKVHHLIKKQIKSIQTHTKNLTKHNLIINTITKKKKLTISNKNTKSKLQKISDTTNKPLT